MTDKKISELPAVVTTSLNDVIPIVQSGTTKKASLATILSSLGTTGYYLDSVPAAAIFNAPGGYFSLNGSTVSLSSLLSFSSAAKYTVGPDGNYVLNSANSPAWDWSTGRRRLLVEAIGATNYWINSETPGAATVAATWSISNAANSLFGTLNRCTLTASVSGDSIVSVIPGLSSGDVTTITIALKNGTGSWSGVGIYGTAAADWGADADSWATVISGPGTVTRNQGALWNIAGATSDTVVRVSRIHRAAESAYAICYTNTTPGQTVSFGRPQFEKGYGSSYVPSGASPTARAADVVTAASGLLALLTAANVTFAFRGQSVSYASGVGGVFIGDNSSGVGGMLYKYPGTFATNVYDNVGGNFINDALATPLVASSSIGVCAALGPQPKIAAEGGAIAKGTVGATLFNSASPSVAIGRNQFSGNVANLFLDELIVWPIFASDAGIQAQARVYS